MRRKLGIGAGLALIAILAAPVLGDWTSPKTWVYGETVTAAELNTQIRDNLLLLKTKIDDDGLLRTMYYGSAATIGNVGAGEDDLESFTLEADDLDGAGQGLRIRTMGDLANNGDSKTLKFYIGAQSITIFSSSTGIANNVWTLDLWFRYGTSTSSQVAGSVTFDAASGAAPTLNHIRTLMTSLDFTSAQTVKFTGEATTTNDIKQLGIQVEAVR